jgi:murein DD-endopeptidase MepM/ murein hydrolase activator NlpD
MGRSGHSELRLMDASGPAVASDATSRLSSTDVWPKVAQQSDQGQPSGDAVLLARQKRAEAQFFGFNDDQNAALSYAEFDAPEGWDTDIDLDLPKQLPTARKAPGGGNNATTFSGLRRSRNPRPNDAIVPVDGLIWPVIGSISSPFGMRRGRLHAGIDIRANRGTPIYSSQSGQVLISARRRAYGNVVVVGHDHNVQTLYAHLTNMIVKPGQYVDRGDVIGYVGRTGRATGYHLHFETRVNGGVPQDPMHSLPPEPRAQAFKKTHGTLARAAF